MNSQTQSATRDALELLKTDHRKVKDAFKAFEALGDRAYRSKEKIVATICEDLIAHMVAEEEVFYPAIVSKINKGKALVDEAIIEHQSAKVLIARLQTMSAEEQFYDAIVTVLSEQIDHHVKEEEEDIFPQVRKTDLDLKELGEEIQHAKEMVA